MKVLALCLLCGVAAAQGTPNPKLEEAKELQACAKAVLGGIKSIPDLREQRFLGKVSDNSMVCRAGSMSLQFQRTPWVDWSQYWGTGDMNSLPKGFISSKGPAFRGVTGALLDLETQRVGLIKFNLFDNSGTWRSYVSGVNGVGGPALTARSEGGGTHDAIAQRGLADGHAGAHSGRTSAQAGCLRVEC